MQSVIILTKHSQVSCGTTIYLTRHSAFDYSYNNIKMSRNLRSSRTAGASGFTKLVAPSTPTTPAPTLAGEGFSLSTITSVAIGALVIECAVSIDIDERKRKLATS